MWQNCGRMAGHTRQVNSHDIMESIRFLYETYLYELLFFDVSKKDRDIIQLENQYEYLNSSKTQVV